MNHGRRLSYSVSGAVVITALAVLFEREGGELFLIPGMWAGMIFDLLFVSMDHWFSWTYAIFNILAYSFLFYLISWVYTGIKDSYHRA